MSTALENLNLEEGKSEALRAVLACITDSSAIDGGPRYSGKTCRELGRVIVCRSYAKPLLELSHLLAAASAGSGRYEDIFWGVTRASAGEFRCAFLALQGASPGITVNNSGIAHVSGGESFQVSYTRMPLLAALLEFMVMTVGYPVIDEMTSELRHAFDREEASDDIVLEAARALQRSLYAYLKDHLPSVQRQRRERHFLTFTDTQAGNRTGTDAINDDVVINYWRAYAASDEIEAKTFRGVYETARKLIAALDAAEKRLSGTHARTIGTDIEQGEVDPADIDAVANALDDDEGPLAQLLDSCGEQVKFVNQIEAEILAELPLGEATARRIPVSVLRNAIFGAAQLRISTALRRGGRPSADLPDAADAYYRDKLQAYTDVIAMTEKLALAALWPLFQAGRSEAVELALALAPDIDWGQLAAGDVNGAEENVVSIGAAGALQQFFGVTPDARGDEIAALLADARRAWRGVHRAGFRDDGDDDSLDIMAGAVHDVLNLTRAVRRTLDRDLGTVDWPSYESADVDIFAAMFGNLYDLKREAVTDDC